ncbi:ATP10 protein-domain-containing protein [Daldinia caldariorum]|uniref:ATP10 protein-domain-containing protein n=1 Tax=Daldinia caldariorum TaxID=326644 RepID=UPI002008E2F9|nr:ATP10 protein-domain-containing protein [Daldinia caldariorum]KAI1466851.1 ATP10 protein-domain-containing protein [Daldinia caldariorum]
MSRTMLLARRPGLLCMLCQSRGFSTSYRLLAEQGPKPATDNQPTKLGAPVSPASPGSDPAPPKVIPPSPLADAPRSYGKRTEQFTPKPLSRPIGMPNPPRPGENTGIDNRTLRQRRDDFVNYDRHLERRKELVSKISRPYFRDWGNLRFHNGKTFYPPPRPFKRDVSLFFPNLHGRTLSKTDRKPRDTTPALRGRISVVSVFSSVWAENQINSFVSAQANPALDDLLARNADLAQRVWLNVEENAFKAWLIRLFMGGIRKRVGEPNWDRYFVVRRGINDDIRENTGLLNRSVGYVYLLDGDCRIRWAGSGPSEDHERDGLVKAVQRLLDEARSPKKA